MHSLPRQKNGRYKSEVLSAIPVTAISEALHRLDSHDPTKFADSTDFDVLFHGRRYPPKRVLGLAGSLFYGIPFTPDDFDGGEDSSCFRALRDAGFAVVSKRLAPRPRRHWWVNHNQTFSFEVPGGYIWSPKRKRDNARNQFYENLTHCAPGDLILSFAGAAIQATGVISDWVQDAERPEEFSDDWSKDGWLVRVTWTRLDRPIRVKDHIESLRPLLPASFGPLQRDTGDGLQSVYLSEISSALYLAVLSLCTQEGVASDLRRSAEEITELSRVLNDPGLRGSERECIVLARIGQGAFRNRVLKLWKRCPVTGVSDSGLLIASHIKPWCESTDQEKVDPSNGIALTPTIDRLFDQGRISFGDDGALLVADRGVHDALSLLHIPLSIRLPALSRTQRNFLEYHRTEILQGA